MRVLVCGSRDWDDSAAVYIELDRLRAEHGDPVTVVHGAAIGADSIAACWALDFGKAESFPADWARHGRAAGPIRNQAMVDSRPDMALAFTRDLSKSRGTADCVRRLRAAGIQVRVVDGRR